MSDEEEVLGGDIDAGAARIYTRSAIHKAHDERSRIRHNFLACEQGASPMHMKRLLQAPFRRAPVSFSNPYIVLVSILFVGSEDEDEDEESQKKVVEKKRADTAAPRAAASEARREAAPIDDWEAQQIRKGVSTVLLSQVRRLCFHELVLLTSTVFLHCQRYSHKLV